MKAKKSRVILSGVSLLLVLCLLVGGTMAWFTDTEKVDTNFTAGILDVSVKPGEEGQTALDFENLRPMLYENFYKELDKNEWNNDVTQGGTTGLKDSHYDPVPAYFKPVDITNEGTLPTKVKLSLEAGNGCADGEPILTKDNITITQDGSKQDCANRLAPVLKVFVYKLVGEDWTLVEGVNLNTAYDEAKANPDGVASENTAEEANSTYMTAMIPANGTERYVIAGYLPETVGNAYQGQHYHGNLVLNAYQMDDTAAGNPDEGGSSSEDPDDPDRFEDNVTIEWRENTADGTLVQSRKVTVKSDTTIAAADYDAPQGYVYSPAAADQSSAVTVDDETGAATPATVVFTVVPEEAETIEYVLQYRNTVDGELLTETKTVSLEVPGEYTIATPDWAGRTVTITAPLPEGYVFDPAVQSFNVSVNAEGVATPATVTFGVKPEGSGEDPEPQEQEVAIQWWCVDPSHEYDYDPDNPAPHKYDHAAGDTTYTLTIAEGETRTISSADVGAPGNNYYVDPNPQSVSVTLKDGVLLNAETQEAITSTSPVRFTVEVEKIDDYPLGGDGSSLHPFMVSDEFELDSIEDHMSAHFRLVEDIDLSDYYWTPLHTTVGTGTVSTGFSGEIDGQNHTINGMTVSLSSNYAGAGLVAYNRGGTIKDLNFTNAYVQAGAVIGTVAGQNTGLIENCHVDTAIYATSVANTNYGYGVFAGGIVGINGGTIRGCTATGTLDANYSGYTGDIAGCNVGTIV